MNWPRIRIALSWLYGFLALCVGFVWVALNNVGWLRRIGYDGDGEEFILLGLVVFALALLSGPFALFPQSVFSRQQPGIVRCVVLVVLITLGAYCGWVIYMLWVLSQATDL